VTLRIVRALIDAAFVVAMAADRTLHRARRLARVLFARPRRPPEPEVIELDIEPEPIPLVRPRWRRRETIPPPPGKPPSEPPPSPPTGAAS
jgi:hypothetical protein